MLAGSTTELGDCWVTHKEQQLKKEILGRSQEQDQDQDQDQDQEQEQE